MGVVFPGLDGTRTALVAADGTAVATIQPPAMYPWRVTQVSVEMRNAPAGATCTLRKNGSLVTVMVAAGDTADSDPPVILRASDKLTAEWAGCTPGDIGRVLFFYDQLAR